MTSPSGLRAAPAAVTVTTEQINSVPLLVGLMESMGLRSLIDAHVTPHGAWQGISPGTLVTLWLTHILCERTHTLSTLRAWVAARLTSFNSLLHLNLRPTDCTDDRLALLLTQLGDPTTQAALDAAMTQQWVRLYRLPTDTVRFDSTSVSVYHDPAAAVETLLHHGHSKDHRPDLRQFKAMLSSLDPLGLPLVCQPVSGQRADDGLYVPSYDATVAALGTAAFLAVGDCKMAALATRGHLVAHGSAYLCPYRPPSASAEIAAWVEQALTRRAQWQRILDPDPRTPPDALLVEFDLWERPQSWCDPATQETHAWTERVLVARSAGHHAAQVRAAERALARLQTELAGLRQPPERGRKRYRTEAALAEVVAAKVAAAHLTGVVTVPLWEETLPDDSCRWIGGDAVVDADAWAAYRERLGWQIYVTNTTAAQYEARALVLSYRQQPVQERGFARLKSRTLHIRPVYLRDETRIAGLLWLLTLALRVLTLTEYRLRRAIAEQGSGIAGLNPADPGQVTRRPTTERVLRVFVDLTLVCLQTGATRVGYVTPLTATQTQILQLLGLPADLYAQLARGSPNSACHLRES